MPRRRRTAGGVDRLPSGRYRVRIVDPASGERVSLGSFATRGAADAAFSSALTDQNNGTWVSPTVGDITLQEYATAWMATRLTIRGEPLRPRTRELYEGLLRLHILPALGDRTLNQLTTASIRAWHTRLRNDGTGLTVAAKSYRLLRTILTTAVEDRVLAWNPCAIKGAGAELTPERRVPTVAQVYELVGAIELRFRAMVLLAAFGGLRRGELFALRRRDLNLLHRTVSVELQRQQGAHGEDIVGPPKTAAGRRTLVLPAEVVAELELHLERFSGTEPDDLVFPGVKGSFLRPHVFQKHWNKARVAVGLPALHFHDLRHVAGTLAATTGAGTKELMHRLGHVSPQAALRYQHATAERDASIADAIDELVRAARSAPNARLRAIGDTPRLQRTTDVKTRYSCDVVAPVVM
jgi:integrase